MLGRYGGVIIIVGCCWVVSEVSVGSISLSLFMLFSGSKILFSVWVG